MTEPGLGGALREALEQIASITCSCHDSADANWHGKRCPKGIALAALSLSSPIEPPQVLKGPGPLAVAIMSGTTGKPNEALEEWLAAQDVFLSERHLGAVKSYIVMNLLPVAPSQASSEVRERIHEIGVKYGGDNPATVYLLERAIEDLLLAAPSRQGAAKRVEG